MRREIIIITIVLLCPCGSGAQVVFWNLENYFDTKDNPMTEDDDFTPEGSYHWTYWKYEQKRNLIAKGIMATAEQFGSFPSIIAVAEAENRQVLDDLLRNTALAKLHYSLLHKESPDPRGIDVAIIYDAKKVSLLKYEFIEIPDFATRDILYTSIILNDSSAQICDTIHLFVNHWPSKRSSDKSDKRRFAVARTMVQHIDAIRLCYGKNAKILLMGDFNDTPESAVIAELCRNTSLVNLSLSIAATGIGSLKYNGKWELIDQFIVSEKMKELVAETMIFQADFLMEKDRKYLGIKPKRTNIGPRYNGGASDHLPILLKFLPALPEDR